MAVGIVKTQNYLVPASGNTGAYPISRIFAAATPFDVDFREFQIDGRSFAPTGVIIDNTLGTADFVVVINEFSLRIVCKKGESLHLGYPAPFNQTVRLLGEGQVVCIFVDYPVIPFSSAVGSGGGGGTGGRSTMFHGFSGAAGAAALAADTEKLLPIVSPTIDTDGWNVAGLLTVPAGVQKIRLEMAVLNMTAGSTAPSLIEVRINDVSGALSIPIGGNSAAGIYTAVVFPIVEVAAGDTLNIYGKSIGAASAQMGAIVNVEVLEGAILNS